MELARMTSKGQLTIPASVRKRLGADKGDQILFYEKDGRMIIASASPSSLSDAQIAAAENHIYSIDEIRSIVAPIAKKHGMDSVWLFGSYARSEATPASDLDFVIKGEAIHSLLQLGGIQSALEEAFHKKVDVLTEESLKPDFSKAIAKNEVLIYERA